MDEVEPQEQFEFPDRDRREPSGRYWTRVISSNLKRGVPHEVVAETLGPIIGNKEDREGIDGLTGLKTKEIFWRDLGETLGVARRQLKDEEAPPLAISLIMMDLDNFGPYNKKHGHKKGDSLLLEVADILQKKGGRRASDVVARYGGEEFCLVLYGCQAENGVKIAEKLREAIEELGITASFGVAESIGGQENPEEFFNRADTACLIAKGEIDHPSVGGKPKNRVVLWRPDMPKKPGE